jgi:hypothetical protein
MKRRGKSSSRLGGGGGWARRWMAVRWPHIFYYRNNPSDLIPGSVTSSSNGSGSLKGKSIGMSTGINKPRGIICLTDAKVEVVRSALEFHIIPSSSENSGGNITGRHKWSMQAASVADMESWLEVVSGRFQHISSR